MKETGNKKEDGNWIYYIYKLYLTHYESYFITLEETHSSSIHLDPKQQPLTPLTHVLKLPGDPQLSFYVYHDMGQDKF